MPSSVQNIPKLSNLVSSNGILPVRSFRSRPKYTIVKKQKQQRQIHPWFNCSLHACNIKPKSNAPISRRLPKCVGMLPAKSFLPRPRIAKLERSPSCVGSEPVRSHLVKSRVTVTKRRKFRSEQAIMV